MNNQINSKPVLSSQERCARALFSKLKEMKDLSVLHHSLLPKVGSNYLIMMIVLTIFLRMTYQTLKFSNSMEMQLCMSESHPISCSPEDS